MAGSEPRRVAGANPYIGPRPFRDGETLHGRDREVRELYYLLSAERVVVLHAPSGAGKSSMVQAGLLNRVRERFDVWRPTRVNLEPPADDDEVNRYAHSAIMGFEEGIPQKLRRPAEELCGQSLAEYVAQRPGRPGAPRGKLLIFDQFEEVLTVDPLNEQARRAFFDQLGELLRDPGIWALFVLREDYLAPLHGYGRQVPTHLRNRYRIELLGLKAAQEAIENPTEGTGRVYAEETLEQLIHDLATMKVQQPDGSFEEETGHHVEPVQLQVVCRRLWDAMPPDDLVIDPGDQREFGDVNEALGAYYAETVQGIARQHGAGSERAMRQWFSDELITQGGIRGQVLRGKDKSGSLDNTLFKGLLGAHLVRAEQRAGATWYELAHDRLVAPVQRSNDAWFATRLQPMQRQATRWARRARPDSLLLAGAELEQAEQWASDHGDELTEDEQAFLKRSRAARQAEEAQAEAQASAASARRMRIALALASVVVVLVLGLAFYAWSQSKVAKSMAVQARTASIEARAARTKAEATSREARRRADVIIVAVKTLAGKEQAEGEWEGARWKARRARSKLLQLHITGASKEDRKQAEKKAEEARAAQDRARARVLVAARKARTGAATVAAVVAGGFILHSKDGSLDKTDLFDISQGATKVLTSGASQPQNMLGAGSGDGEGRNVIFAHNDRGFVHWVTWQTRADVDLNSVALFAGHDGNVDGYRLRRSFNAFRLWARVEGSWKRLVEYRPALPYGGIRAAIGGGGGKGDHTGLAVCLDVEKTKAREFKAEFVQAVNILNQYSGPRVMELNGYGDVGCKHAR